MLDQSEPLDADSLQSPQIRGDETVRIIDFGCGFQERARTCWLEHGLADAMKTQFPGKKLEVTGLDLWWDRQHDFDFRDGRFRGTVYEKDLPEQANAIVWRYPNPLDVGGENYDRLDKDEGSVLAAVQRLARERLAPGGFLFFETDLTNGGLVDAINTELNQTGLERVGEFETQGSFYKHRFGAEYMKKAA